MAPYLPASDGQSPILLRSPARMEACEWPLCLSVQFSHSRERKGAFREEKASVAVWEHVDLHRSTGGVCREGLLHPEAAFT